ncbi:dioxygenase [Paracoccus shandongensis]|uniref:dioxygenase family protein n=1 Tax=Paracoccus shandongensis TaxID=2816048 RepID=UPI001A8F59B0|nr:dioxygenase [Paracoccus shandongensis]
MDDCREPSRDPAPNGIGQDLQRRLAAVAPSRLGASVALIARQLHLLVAELHPTTGEFRQALGFLTDVGHHTDHRRQEWVLLADVLGVSALVEEMNAHRPQGATPNTVTGPFYRADAPELPLGSDLSRDGKGERLRVSGQVTDTRGRGLPGAVIEVWHANAAGIYENQQPDCQPEFNLRGKLRADGKGRFTFLSVKPGGYALPSDGPVGRLMAALGCPLDRPAHIHFRVTVPGHQTLTTHIFDRADPAIGRDAVFGVRPALLADFRAIRTEAGTREHLLDLKLALCPLRQAES